MNFQTFFVDLKLQPLILNAFLKKAAQCHIPYSSKSKTVEITITKLGF